MRTIQLDYKNIGEYKEELTLCLGYFDGIHIGHQKVISDAVKDAKYKTGIMTFDKPVSTLIENGKSKETLTSLDDRFRILARYNLDYYFVLHIDRDFLNLSKDDFIELLKKLNVKELFVGDDYHFGKNAEGKIKDLEKHFETHSVKSLENRDRKISVQNIIRHIRNGELNEAKLLLGRNYMISGVVGKGKGLGHTIGYPTMNLETFSNYVLPKYGVYKTIAYLDNVPHISITNVGVKPTVGGNKPCIEVHIPNFNEDTYGRNLAVEFIEFIRAEIKFSSIEELKHQINDDIKKVR